MRFAAGAAVLSVCMRARCVGSGGMWRRLTRAGDYVSQRISRKQLRQIVLVVSQLTMWALIGFNYLLIIVSAHKKALDAHTLAHTLT